MQRMIEDAYRNGKFSDLKIEFHGKTHNLHKVVVCGQSKVMNAMCTGNFKESKSDVINLTEDTYLDETQLQCLLDFFYHQQYCTFPNYKYNPENSPRPEVVTGPSIDFCRFPDPEPVATKRVVLQARPQRSTTRAGRVFQFRIGREPDLGEDYHDYQYLRPSAPKHHWMSMSRSDRGYEVQSPPPPPSPVKQLYAIDRRGKPLSAKFHALMYATADRYDVARLSEFAKLMFEKTIGSCSPADPKEFLESVVTVYSTTPDSNTGLRKIVADYMKKNMTGIKDKKVLRPIIEEVPGFAADVFELFDYVAPKATPVKGYKPHPYEGIEDEEVLKKLRKIDKYLNGEVHW